MSKENTIAIDGVEQWLYLINRFKLDPKEALATMEKHGQDVESVLVYLESILKYYTINIKGDFGIALNVFDKVDLQPFQYGIYLIELFIDSTYHYGIEYNKTSFEQSNQIYLERNYRILSEKNEEYYQLFKNKFQDNTFINKKSKGFIQKNTGIHSFQIIVKDIKENQTEITGYFIINDLINFEYEVFKLVDDGWKIDFKDIDKIIDFEGSIYKQSNDISQSIICSKKNPCKNSHTKGQEY